MGDKGKNIFGIYQRYLDHLDDGGDKINEANRELYSALCFQSGVFKSLSEISVCLYIVDIRDNTYVELSAADFIKEITTKCKGAQEVLNTIAATLVKEKYRQMMAEFTDLTTLSDRIGDKDGIMLDFDGVYSGWSRGFILPVRRAADGTVEMVMFFTQRIEDDKLREKLLEFDLDNMWITYEDSDIPMYAADIDTYELIYMNRVGRKMCGDISLASLRGEKCYEMLQKKSAPCDFCTNEKLREGQVYKYEMYNPSFKMLMHIADQKIVHNGRNIRIEQIYKINKQNVSERTPVANSITVISDALRLVLEEQLPEKGLTNLIEYIGIILEAERVYIFELTTDNKAWYAAYEWYRDGIVPQKYNLKNIPVEATGFLNRIFKKSDFVEIDDRETIRESESEIYKYMEMLDARSITAAPIMTDNRLLGFVCISNPSPDIIKSVEGVIPTLGQVITSLLERREIARQLDAMSYSDQMTELGNRHAVDRFLLKADKAKSIGVILCDLCSLKYVNDNMGHTAGDEYILQARDILFDMFEETQLFRWGGDELLVLADGIPEEEFLRLCETLRETFIAHQAPVSVGHVWSSKLSEDLLNLIQQADRVMYKHKKEMYRDIDVRGMLKSNPRLMAYRQKIITP